MAKKTNAKTAKIVGGAIAAALAVGAAIFLTSPRGKEVREDAADRLAEFYKSVSPKVKKMKKLSQKEYDEFMKTAAHHFGKAKKLSQEAVDELVEQAQGSWSHIAKQMEK